MRIEKSWKRVLSLIIALVMVVGLMPPASASAVTMTGGEKLYLKPNSNWKEANARFSIYVFNSSGNAWASMEGPNRDGIYEATVPSGNWTNVIFVRMDSSSTNNTWDTDWNQTSDLEYNGTDNLYTVAEGAWSNGSGTWSTYEAPAAMTVTIHFQNTEGWASVNGYAWNTNNGAKLYTDGWPGTATDENPNDGWHTMKLTDVRSTNLGVIFNNGSGSQTRDIFITNAVDGGEYWCTSDGLSSKPDGWNVFDIKVEAENGTVTAPATARQGENVTLSVAPDGGFVLTSLTVKQGEEKLTLTKNDDGTYTFTMPGGDVTVSATFVACDHATTKAEPNGNGTHNIICTNSTCNGYVVTANVPCDYTTGGTCACGVTCNHSGNTAQPVDSSNGKHSFTCTVCDSTGTEDCTFGDTDTCICGAKAKAKVVSDETNTYYATLEKALEAGGNVYPLADYAGDFTIPVGTSFYGEGYTFAGTVTNWGYIQSGTFTGDVTHSGHGIEGGTFDGTVTANAIITGGIFKGAVTTNTTIDGGTFYNTVLLLDGDASCITDGTFNGTVTNNGTITGGTFNGAVTNNGTINNTSVPTTFTLGDDFVLTGEGEVNCTEHFEKTAATCAAKAVCRLCGEYGEKERYNHAKTTYTNGFRDCCGEYQAAVLNGSVYEISNAGQLYWFAAVVNGGYGSTARNLEANAVLTADITIPKTVGQGGTVPDWTPIGNSLAYEGTFDGAGKTVSGLYFNNADESNVGFVGKLSGGAVKNLTVKDSSLHAKDRVGGIVGNADYGGTVKNCSFSGKISATAESANVGGIVGSIDNYGLIESCFNAGSVSANGLSSCAGGIVGRSYDALVQYCMNSGSISGNGSVGGIAGLVNVSAAGELGVQYCGNTGNIKGGSSAIVGGLIGMFADNYSSSQELKCCYSAGGISGGSTVGGLIGESGLGGLDDGYSDCYFDKSKYAGVAVGYIEGSDSLYTGTDTAYFASGAATCWLNGSVSGEGIWKQTLGVDTYPNFTGSTVYYGYTSCAENAVKVYTNDSTAGATKPGHTPDESSYTAKDDSQHSYSCIVCGETFTENHTLNYENPEAAGHRAFCEFCDYEKILTHSYDSVPGQCEHCGYVCDHEVHTQNGCACGITDSRIHTSFKYQDNGDGTHNKVCKVCNHVESAHPHSYGDDHLCVCEKGEAFAVSLANDIYYVTVDYSQTATFGTDYTATITPDQYFYIGDDHWVTIGGKDYTGYTLAEGVLTIPGADITGEIVIYARGYLIPAEVTWDYNGGTVVVEHEGEVWIKTQSGANTYLGRTTDTAFCVELDKLTRSGYLLTGWNTVKEPTEENPGVAYAKDADIFVDKENIVLYAQWTKIDLSAENGTYNGQAHKPAVTIEGMTEGTDFQVTYPADMTSVGEKTITVTDLDEYGSTTTVTYTVEARDISDAVVTMDDDLTYNGKTQNAKITKVQLGDMILTEGTDYTLSGNTAANSGEHELTVTGTGNFTGSVKAEWKIAKRLAAITAKDQTITYGDDISGTEYTADGLVDGHSVSVTLTPNTDKVTVNGSIAVSGAKITAGDVDVTANYDITYASGKLVIDPDVSDIKDLTAENVTSADEEAVKAVQDMLDNAESTKEEWADISEKCEQLLDRIDEVKKQNEAIAEDVASFDEESVNSDDKAALEELAEEMEALLESENLTQKEREALGVDLEQVEDMIAVIEQIAADSKAATDQVEALDSETVTSDDQTQLEQAVANIEELLETDHLTEEERKALAEVKASAETMLETVEAAHKAVDTESINNSMEITAENVSREDKEILAKAKSDLEKALHNHGGNYTEEEKQIIRTELVRIQKALEVIENAEDVEAAIDALPETVVPDDGEMAIKILNAKAEYDALTEHEKSLVTEAAVKKLNGLLAALTDYRLIMGGGGIFTKESEEGLYFKANGHFDKFTGILVDGKAVDKANYEAKSGSTIVILKPAYLDTLAEGEHTLTFLYTDGEVSGTFLVKAKAIVPPTTEDEETVPPTTEEEPSTTPPTGDGFQPMLWIAVMSISLGLMVLLEERRRNIRK